MPHHGSAVQEGTAAAWPLHCVRPGSGGARMTPEREFMEHLGEITERLIKLRRLTAAREQREALDIIDRKVDWLRLTANAYGVRQHAPRRKDLADVVALARRAKPRRGAKR